MNNMATKDASKDKKKVEEKKKPADKKKDEINQHF